MPERNIIQITPEDLTENAQETIVIDEHDLASPKAAPDQPTAMAKEPTDTMLVIDASESIGTGDSPLPAERGDGKTPISALDNIKAVLTLIRYIVRLAKFLSSDAKRALEEAEAQLSHMNPVLSANEADEVIIRTFHKRMPRVQVEAAFQDLAQVTEVLQPAVQGIEPGVGKGNLLYYGTGLHLLTINAALKLEKWGCFGIWGKGLPIILGEPDYFKTLVAESTTANFRKSRTLMALLVPSLRKSNLYFCQANGTAFPGLALTCEKYEGLHSLDTERRLSQLVSQPGRAVNTYSLEYYLMNFAVDSLQLVGYIMLPHKDTPISKSDFELIAIGILDDFVHYARLVRAKGKAG